MNRIVDWLRTLPPRVILAIGWCLFMVHAYPGRMTRDSFDQLKQARSGVFADDHPPLMQAIVWVTDIFVAGPVGPVILQSVMFLAGMYLLLRRAMRARVAALVALVVLFLPPVASVMVVMWKDPLMAGALMLAVPLVIAERRRTRLLGLALAVVATGVRFNALAATFGVIVVLFEWNPLPHLKRYALALAVWVAVTATAFGINTLITSRETHFFESSLLDDLVGTLNFVEGDRPDPELRELFAGMSLRLDHDIHAGLRRAYRSDTMLWYMIGDNRLFDLKLVDEEPLTPEIRAKIAAAWKKVVFGNFGAYLRYRIDRFRVVLGLERGNETVWSRDHLIVTHDYQDKAAMFAYGVSTTTSGLQHTIDEVWDDLSHTWLFRPYVYLALTLVLLVLGRRNAVVIALLLSGLGNEMSLFFLAHSPDYRYSHWMICTTIAAVILVFAERLRGRNPRPA